MSSQKPSSEHMLGTYLFSTNGIVDRFVLARGYNLRSNDAISRPATHPITTRSQKDKDQNTEVAVSKLEKEMDKITDPILVADARAYQQGEDFMSFALPSQ